MSCCFVNAKFEALDSLGLKSGGHETLAVADQPFGRYGIVWLVSVSLVLPDAHLCVFGAQICILSRVPSFRRFLILT